MDTVAKIRNISDTALWVAVYRARESERPDAIFRDPLARRLAGERGEQIAASMPYAGRHAWSYIARTWLVDQFLQQRIQDGADMVVNLAAGLDTRPYRMSLPAALNWVDIDLPDMLAYKQQLLATQKPACRVERVALDLMNASARRECFDRLGREARQAIVVTEGFIIYLTSEQAAALARDIAATKSFRYWILDLASPALLSMLQKRLGTQLGEVGSPLKFAPPEGPDFFASCGWKLQDAHSLLKTAAKLRRLSFGMRLLSLLPDPAGRDPNKPWGGVCLFENAAGN